MAVMDLVPPPVAMMAMSGTWGHREADCWDSGGHEETWSDGNEEETVEEGELAAQSRTRRTEGPENRLSRSGRPPGRCRMGRWLHTQKLASVKGSEALRRLGGLESHGWKRS